MSLLISLIPFERNTSLKNDFNKSESEIIGDPYQLKPKAEDIIYFKV